MKNIRACLALALAACSASALAADPAAPFGRLPKSELDGAGCQYFARGDKPQKSAPIAEDSFTGPGDGVIAQINGKKVFLSQKPRKGDKEPARFKPIPEGEVEIAFGKFKSCGEECFKADGTISITPKDGPKASTPITAVCGS